MSDENLRAQLRRFTVPAASEAARSRARHRAVIAFGLGHSGDPARFDHRALVPRWTFALAALALFCGAVAIWMALRPPPENFAEDRELIRQMEKVFPGHLDSIIENNGKIDLSIAQSPVVGTNQPVVIVFRRGGEAIRVLSYSGHHLCVSLGTHRSCLDILATPSGGVILEGDKKVWLASPDTELAGYHVTARALSTL